MIDQLRKLSEQAQALKDSMGELLTHAENEIKNIPDGVQKTDIENALNQLKNVNFKNPNESELHDIINKFSTWQSQK